MEGARTIAAGAIGLVALCLLFASIAAGADQLYRWVDADGHVHYSQTPPPSTAVKAQAVKVEKPQQYSTDPQLLQQEEQVSQAAAAQAKADQDKAAAAAKDKALQQQRCDAWRSKLQFYQRVGPVFTVDADGNRHYASDAEHQQAEQQLQDQIAKGCGGQQP